MECDVYCRIVCRDKEQLKFIALMLSNDIDKPMFEEEVEERYQPLYEALEFIDEPQAVETEKKTSTLLCHFFMGDALKAKDLAKTLAILDVAGFYCVIFLDGDDPSLAVVQFPEYSAVNRWPEGSYDAMCEADSDPIDVLCDIETYVTDNRSAYFGDT